MNGEKDIVTRLNEELPGYSKRQRNIARYICDNVDKAAFMTAEMLSQAANVSESTVVRFATELGFDGYPGLRRALQQVLRSRLTSISRDESGRLSPVTELFYQSMEADSYCLKNAADEKNSQSFEAFLKVIMAEPMLYIAGLGKNSFLSGYFAKQLSLLRRNVQDISPDIPAGLYTAQEGDSLLLLGDGSEGSELARCAKERGLCLLAIASQQSPVLMYAQHSLIAEGAALLGLVNAIMAGFELVSGKSLKEIANALERNRMEYKFDEQHEN